MQLFDKGGKAAKLGLGLGGESPVGGVEEHIVERMRNAVVGHLYVGGELEVVGLGFCRVGLAEVKAVGRGEVEAVVDVDAVVDATGKDDIVASRGGVGTGLPERLAGGEVLPIDLCGHWAVG